MRSSFDREQIGQSAAAGGDEGELVGGGDRVEGFDSDRFDDEVAATFDERGQPFVGLEAGVDGDADVTVEGAVEGDQFGVLRSGDAHAEPGVAGCAAGVTVESERGLGLLGLAEFQGGAGGGYVVTEGALISVAVEGDGETGVEKSLAPQ